MTRTTNKFYVPRCCHNMTCSLYTAKWRIGNRLTPLSYRSHENRFSRKCGLSCNESIARRVSRKEEEATAYLLRRRMALWEVKRGMHVDTIARPKDASNGFPSWQCYIPTATSSSQIRTQKIVRHNYNLRTLTLQR